ncbi:tRNA1(Val) (adenine(37)-N6)-methyltransferase [Hydrogenivirga sp.]
MRDSGKKLTFFGGKLHLIQPKKHRVSVDLVVFLSRVRGIKRSSRVVELGAGFGFLSITLAKKFGCEVHALERDGDLYELLEENIRLNSLEDKVKPLRIDIRQVGEHFRRGSFDVVVVNPPFYPKNYGSRDGGFHFEEDTTLGDFIGVSSYLLRDGGYMNLLIPCFRLYESFSLMKESNLPPRFTSIIYPTADKEGRLAVISSIRNVPGPLHVERAIFINREEGGYTQEVESLLEGFL